MSTKYMVGACSLSNQLICTRVKMRWSRWKLRHFYRVKSKHSPLLQDGSTNSSPVLSSAENSFIKSKLVVRAFCLKCHWAHYVPIFKYYRIFFNHRIDKCIIFIAFLSWQNTSQSSLDDSFDQLDCSESQSVQEPPLYRPQRGERSIFIV